MSKIGRNDPCPCGSGKKYKQCHLPIDEAAQAEQRRLRRAVDTLLPKLIVAARDMPDAAPAAFERFWGGKYGAEQMAELDDLQDRGAERFLPWFAFDYRLDGGYTLVERLAAGEGAIELSDEETRLLPAWAAVRLRPYVVESAVKGQGMQVRDLLDETAAYEVEDHAASRRMAPGEVLVAHLVPAAGRFYIGGAAAHLTEDTRDRLREFLGLHLEAFARDRPGATWDDLLRDRSEVLNHFVMELPVEEPDPGLLENIIAQTRISLRLAGESLGLVRSEERREPEEGRVERGE